MRTIWRLAKQEVLLILSDRQAMIWSLIMPIAFATFFGLVGGSSSQGGDGTVYLTLVDEDRGPVAVALREALDDERLNIVEVSTAERATVEDPVRTLVIPSGFSANVLAGESVALRLEKEPDASAQASLVAQARILAAISRVLARLVEATPEGGTDQTMSAEAFLAVESRPDLVSVETRFAGQAKIIPGGFAQSVPGNVVMFVLLVTLTYGAASISNERQIGLLRRLATTPVSRLELILGKVLGRFATAAVQIGVLVLVAWIAELFLDLGLARLDRVFVVLLVYALSIAPLAMLVGGWIRDPDRASNVGVLLTLTMASLGGCWWPLEVVSEPLQRVAMLFPTGWAMSALHQVLSYGQDLVTILPTLLVLLGFAVLGTLVAARALRFDG